MFLRYFYFSLSIFNFRKKKQFLFIRFSCCPFERALDWSNWPTTLNRPSKNLIGQFRDFFFIMVWRILQRGIRAECVKNRTRRKFIRQDTFSSNHTFVLPVEGRLNWKIENRGWAVACSLRRGDEQSSAAGNIYSFCRNILQFLSGSEEPKQWDKYCVENMWINASECISYVELRTKG